MHKSEQWTPLFTRTGNLTEEAKRNVDLEDRTSEDSAIVRAEVREIFEEMTKEIPEKGTEGKNVDREQYEAELEKARKIKKRQKGELRRKKRKTWEVKTTGGAKTK